VNKTRLLLVSGLSAVVVGVGLGGYALSGGFSSSPAPAASMAPSMSASPSMSSMAPSMPPSVMPSAMPSQSSAMPSPSPAAGSGTSECTNGDLTVSLGTKGAAAGSAYQEIVFTNKGMDDCTLFGYPGAALTSGQSSMDQIGQAAGRDTTSMPETVTLAPGQSADSTLRISDAGNYPQTMGNTEESADIQLYVPDQMSPVYIPYMAEGTTIMSVPLLSITPVVAS
jgi:hypothetical protein